MDKTGGRLHQRESEYALGYSATWRTHLPDTHRCASRQAYYTRTQSVSEETDTFANTDGNRTQDLTNESVDGNWENKHELLPFVC